MIPREQAVRKVLLALSNPLYMMSIPSREEVYRLIDEFNITIKEVLEYRQKQSERS
jgi:hypothetical protein